MHLTLMPLPGSDQGSIQALAILDHAASEIMVSAEGVGRALPAREASKTQVRPWYADRVLVTEFLGAYLPIRWHRRKRKPKRVDPTAALASRAPQISTAWAWALIEKR